MKSSTKFILISSVAIVATVVAGVIGVSAVSAQMQDTNYPAIIQNLAERFGLNPDEVQDVFEETHDERISDHLDKLVEDGTITEEQKAVIIEKQEEHEAKMEEIRDDEMTMEERRNAMDQLRDEMKDWADENDIPQEALMGRGGMRGGMHGGEHGMCMECDM